MSDVLTSSRDALSPPVSVVGSLAALREALAVEAPALAPRLDALAGDLVAGTAWATASSPCAAIPEIDYDGHPYYRTLIGDDGLRTPAADRFFEIFSGMIRAEEAMSSRFGARVADRSDDPAYREAAAAMKRDGIHRFRLGAADVAAILARSEAAARTLELRRQTLPPKHRGVGAVIEPLADQVDANDDFEFYDDLLRRNGVHEIAEQSYGCPFRLLNVGLQANTGDDTGIARVCTFPDGRRSPAYYLHVDSAAGVLKVLMYRSEKVTAANGAFRYMPGSHQALGSVERAIRKTIDKGRFEKLDDETRRLFMALPPCFRRKANYGNDLLPEAGFDAEGLMSQEMLFEGEAGDAVLVDINGAHRGNIHTDRGGRREMFKFVLKASW